MRPEDAVPVAWWLREFRRRKAVPDDLPPLPVAIACLALAFLLSCTERLAS